MPYWIKLGYFKKEINLYGVLRGLAVHTMALYGFYLAAIGRTKIYTVLWHMIIFYTSILGKMHRQRIYLEAKFLPDHFLASLRVTLSS